MKLAVTLAFCFIVKVVTGNTVLQKLSKGECPPSCPDRWLRYQGSCYLYGNEPLTFANAQGVCEDSGSHLVDINDEAENTFIKDIARQMTPHYWFLGLTGSAARNDWTWSNGSQPTFTDWVTGQPDGEGNCVILHHGYHDYKWTDNPCTRAYYFICEM
ncbi:LECG-like protein [Mya arenaria]|uniref:LECG-like protein n=1 Tax=Mya arenaria TaxID=6604 RepID=A0ABY7DW70_MYAAR|nr:LECG-like protein [Mya arenaria]